MPEKKVEPLTYILPEHLQEQLKQPICVPMPKVTAPSITLPTGATLKGVVDLTKSIPGDCSLSFSLMLQLPPLLANLDCLIKILALLKPMTDVVKGFPKMPSAELVDEVATATENALPCLNLAQPGLPWKNLIRDILCLIIKIMSCLIQQLKAIVSTMRKLDLAITAAQDEPNPGSLARLQCDRDNKSTEIANSMSAIEPITLLLGLVEPFLGLAGVNPIEIPTFGSPKDVEEAEQEIEKMKSFVDGLQLVADGLGGCP